MKRLIYEVVKDTALVELLFPVIKAQRRVLMGDGRAAGRDPDRRRPQGHQECPPERPSPGRPRSDRCPPSPERRCHPGLRHREAGLDPAAADEAPRAGARDAPRVPRPRDPLRLGPPASCFGSSKSTPPRGRAVAPSSDAPRPPGHARAETRRSSSTSGIGRRSGRPCRRCSAKWERASCAWQCRRVFVQRMKTKWGSCNPRAGTIRLNTELARKPPGVPRVPGRPRAGAPAGAHAQRPLRGADGPLPARLAIRPADPQPPPRSSRGLGVLRPGASGRLSRQSGVKLSR